LIWSHCESSPQKRSRMESVLKGFQFYLHTHTSIRNQNEPNHLSLPSYSLIWSNLWKTGRLTLEGLKMEWPRPRFKPASSQLIIRHSTTQLLVHLHGICSQSVYIVRISRRTRCGNNKVQSLPSYTVG